MTDHTNTTELSFFAGGIPRPQGSKKAYVRNGHAHLVEMAGAALTDWRMTVGLMAQQAITGPPLQGPIIIRLIFCLPRPKSHPKKRRTWPVARPDIDKLIRAVLDALTGVVYGDDSQVIRITARKIWARVDTNLGPGVYVTVRAHDEPEP